ncbi:MOSC domain-containing protein [Leifsonia sp. Root112D2]|uniref:MOSC domain-containing protein n=1 Tax=Leifsonia sp. Root112D2 TaxID=1736426 RepID=UPI000700573A|nr:MOSC domain-containing protein [Leifsonia sp. Root112D2]KQV06924.1 molybdenum cofactor biosysynthesis protein [Leifsonia sp. Root112D2]
MTSSATDDSVRNGAPAVISVSRDDRHGFSKPVVDEIVLVAGLGVQGDAHYGATVQHRSRVARDPSQPNLRQVHLIQAEVFDEVRTKGFEVLPGQMGENVTTRGLNLLELPRGSILHLGTEATVEVTGLRNPCSQINDFQPRLLNEMVGVDDAGAVVRKAGVMGIVLQGGRVRAGDTVVVELPDGPRIPLDRV